jgi:hypothetical protein
MTRMRMLSRVCNLVFVKTVMFIMTASAFGGDVSLTGGMGFAGGNHSTPWRVGYEEKITSNFGYRASYINYWHFRHFEHRNNHVDGLALQLTAGKDYEDFSINAGLGPFGFFNTINERRIKYGVDLATFISADFKLGGPFFWRNEVSYAPGFSDGVRTFYILAGPVIKLGLSSSENTSDEANAFKYWVALSAGKTSLNNLGTPKSPLALNIEAGRKLSGHSGVAISWLHEGHIHVRDGSIIERNGIVLQPRLFAKILDAEGSVGAGPYYETNHSQFNLIFTALITYPIGDNWDLRAAWDRILDGDRGADVLHGGIGFRF